MGIIKSIYKKYRYCKTLQGLLQFLAMNSPHHRLAVLFNRMRGVKIGKNVYIDRSVFIDTFRPHLITIMDNVEIGPNAMIIATDSSYNHIFKEVPIFYKGVEIRKNAYIGAGAIILPGVTIGESAIVGAGAVVTKAVPFRTVVAGVPARKIKTVDAGLTQLGNIEIFTRKMRDVPKMP